jgi:hypothetical protein
MVFASSAGSVGAIVFIVALLVVVSVPAYVIGKRRGVGAPGVAFIPVIGPTIVLLWSSDRSGWLAILGLIPWVNIIFGIWLVFTFPAEHGRTRWWAVPFLIPLVNVIGFYAYAFTLEHEQIPSYEPTSLSV